MRNHFSHIVAALVIAAAAAAAIACSEKNTSVANERVALRGCVRPAPSGQGLALTAVVPVSSVDQPQGLESMQHPLIARGSWVRLDPAANANDDLANYLGKEVTIAGEIVDRGENTVGTSGQDKQPPRAALGNSDAPRIAVAKIAKVAENCAGE